jgi:putative oxidoreductase
MATDPLRMARFTGLFHALLRFTAGLSFMSHGMMKLLGFPPAPPGMPPMPVSPMSFMGVAGMLELIGGFLLVIGLFTRPVAFLLSGQMAVAYWMAHAPQGPYPATNMGEAAYLFCFVFLYLAAAGAGPFSLDNRTKS